MDDDDPEIENVVETLNSVLRQMLFLLTTEERYQKGKATENDLLHTFDNHPIYEQTTESIIEE